MGYVSTSCRVKVGAPPRIENIPSELHLSEGDNTKIKVEWSDDMPFTVKFFRNGEELVDNARIKMTLFDKFLIIFMGDITKDDAGKFASRVSNQSGSTEESLMIYISGQSGAPIEASEIISHTSKLEWNIPTLMVVPQSLIMVSISEAMNGSSFQVPARANHLQSKI